ncbi:MAG: hypothetical protein JNL82_07325 [Myxococcales bacterium]|nr:hypothetical protein [Myxococcales bacterium]
MTSVARVAPSRAVPLPRHEQGEQLGREQQQQQRVKPTLTALSREAMNLAECERACTLRLAAATIADPRFPSEELLPRVDPIPFNNLGHMPLIDYKLLCETLWGCVYTLHERSRSRPRPRISRGRWIAAGACVATIGGLAVAGELPLLLLFAPVMAGLVLLFGLSEPARHLDPEESARVRGDYLHALLLGEAPAAPASLPAGQVVRVEHGRGLLSRERVCVFFARDEQNPFPGLGRVQGRDAYVCSPGRAKDGKSPPAQDLPGMCRALEATVTRTLREEGLAHVHSGYAVVVKAAGLRPGSPWLDGEGRPILYLDADGRTHEELSAMAARDPAGESRLFFGVQVFFPEHLTLVSIMFRVHYAATAISLQTVVSTLGPPRDAVADLQQVLRRHLSAPVVLPDGTVESRLPIGELETASALARRLQARRRLATSEADPLAGVVTYKTLDELTARERRTASEAHEAQLLRYVSHGWPGMGSFHSSWRDQRSLTMSNDFFGEAECKATLRTLYVHIVEGVLTMFEDRGYDTAAYASAPGKWTINAGIINNMTVGETIHIAEAQATSGEQAKGEARP